MSRSPVSSPTCRTPRADRTKRRRLDDILGITLCAVRCGADSFDDIERFGDARQDWLKAFLALPSDIPSYDTFNRVLAAFDRTAFAAGFGRSMAALCAATGWRPIAIDEKACRSAPADTFSGCLHLDQRDGRVGEELAGDYEQDRRAYLALERNFETLGDPDAASWAYRRKRRMEKKGYRLRARREWAAGRRRKAAVWGLRSAYM